jgi:hypothetical protein
LLHNIKNYKIISKSLLIPALEIWESFLGNAISILISSKFVPGLQ